MMTIIVIPQIINFVFFDIPRLIIKTTETANAKATTTNPIAKLKPPSHPITNYPVFVLV